MFTTARLATAFGLVWVCVSARADTEIWRSDWFQPSPPTLSPGPTLQAPAGRLAFGANGDVVVGGQSYPFGEYQFTRIGLDGALRWSSNLGYTLNLALRPNAVVATDDGGALVVFGDFWAAQEQYAVRIDASGNIAWMHAVPAHAIAIGGGRAIAVGCPGATAFDDATGTALWQREAPTCFFESISTAIAADGAGGAFVVGGMNAGDLRAIHFDADGRSTWNVQVVPPGTDFYDAKMLGPAGGFVFVDAGGLLTALRVADGSRAWSVPAGDRAVLAGAPPEPIVIGGSVSRLDIATGAPRWSVPVAGVYNAAASDDALIIGVPTHAVARIDLATGATLWTKTLPLVDGFGNTLRNVEFGAFVGDAFTVVEQPETDADVPPVLQRIALADGALAGTIEVPVVPQAPTSSSVGDGDRIVATQRAQTTTGPALGLRRLAVADGSVDWSIADPIALGPEFYSVPTRVNSGVGALPDGIAVATALSIGQGVIGGTLRVAYYDRATGARRWERFLGEGDQGDTYSAAPLADSNGDLFVASGSSAFCAPGIDPACFRQTLYKLSKTDGHVIWHAVDEYSSAAGGIPYPNDVTLVGNDAVLQGPFEDGFSPDTLRAIDGATGTTRWASQIFGYRRIESVYAVDGDVLAVANGDGWARLDPLTGAARWTGPAFAAGCATLCNPVTRSILLPDGDVLAVGDVDYRGVVTRLSGDGSGAFQSWVLDPASAERTQIVEVARDASGGIWLAILRGFQRGAGGVAVVAKFDPSSGTLTRQQVWRARTGEPLDRMTLAGWIGAPENERLLLEATTLETPLPTVGGNVVLDTHVTATGDLATSLDIGASDAYPNERLAFHAHLAYTGASALAGAHLNVYLPWGSGARNVVCAPTNASNCSIDTRGDSVRATVDLAPGAVVDLTGQVLVLEPERGIETSNITAVSYGPLGLDEPDTRNNLAAQSVSYGIFRSGFESN